MSESSIERYIQWFNCAGDVPKNQRHGPLPAMSEFDEVTLLQTLLNTYLLEVQDELSHIIGSLYMIVQLYVGISRDSECQENGYVV